MCSPVFSVELLGEHKVRPPPPRAIFLTGAQI